jgi:hypothetical protein
MNYPQGDQEMPYKEYEREKIRAAGQALDTVQTFVKGYKYKDCKMKVYPQNATWLDDICRGAIGMIPLSHYFKYEQPTEQFDCFGMVLTSYEFESSADNFASESLGWTYYEVDEGAVIGSGKVFDTTQPTIHKDVALSIGGTTINNIDKLGVSITRELLNTMAAGKYQRMDPVLIKRDTKITATFYDSSDALITGTRDADTATQLVEINVDCGTKTLRATNMILEEVNANFIPEFGLYKYEVTYVNGGTTVLSTA